MNKIVLIVGMTSLLGACGSGSGNGSSNGATGTEQNGQAFSNMLKPVNGRKAIFIYHEGGSDESFTSATLSKDGNFINVFGQDIDITKASDDGVIEVDKGNSESNGYWHQLNNNLKFANFGSIRQLDTDKKVNFVVGKLTEKLPQKGKFEYVDKFVYNDGSVNNDLYVVDFDKKTVSADLSKYHKYQATIFGNTFKTVDLLEYNAVNDKGTNYQYKTSMNGAFFGPNAEEIAGTQTRQIKEADKAWESEVYLFGANKQ